MQAFPVRASNFEGSLPEMSHLFTVKTKGCHLFMPEALVSRETPQEPSLGPTQSSGGPTEVGGVRLTEAEMAANHEAFDNLEKKLKEDLEKAIPDQSINLTEQREALQLFEEQEKQRAQQRRQQPPDETHRIDNAAPGQFNKPHPQQEDRVRAQEEQLGVPSVPELRKAHSLPFGNSRPGKPRPHSYEDADRHLSGGLQAAVQDNQYARGEHGQPLPPKPRYTPPPKPRYPPNYQPGYPPNSQPGYPLTSQPGYPPPSQPGFPPPASQPGYRPAPQSTPPYHPHQPPYEHGHGGQQLHDPLLNPRPRVVAVDERSEARGQQPFSAFTYPPGADVPVPHVHLTTGSMVQLSDPPWYGVIRWVGELPAVHGLVAGVEMVRSHCPKSLDVIGVMAIAT